MTLVIEDGSIVSGADSYVTISEYTAWANKRFGASRSTAPSSDGDTEALIYRATDYFESQSFKGFIVEDGQPMQWPRSWVVIDGYSVENSEIPKEVKTAIYELAYAQETGAGQMNQIERAKKKTKVDVIEVEYADNASSRTLNPSVSLSLRKLVKSSDMGGAIFSVSRA
jgi:hypothetical protein